MSLVSCIYSVLGADDDVDQDEEDDGIHCRSNHDIMLSPVMTYEVHSVLLLQVLCGKRRSTRPRVQYIVWPEGVYSHSICAQVWAA